MEAWRNLRIHNLRFSRTITTDRQNHAFPNNGIGFLTDIARLTHRELKSMAHDQRLKSRFCKAAGLSGEEFALGLKLTKDPASYAYSLMRGYNAGQKRPRISFTMDKPHIRYYVAGPR